MSDSPALQRCRELIAELPDESGRELLLRLLAGGDPNGHDEDEDTALHLCCGSPQLAEALLRTGADPNAHNNLSDTPLHNACDAEDAELVRVLLRHGADPNAIGMTMQTPLFRTQNAEIAELLLAAGANPDAVDVDGWVPLHGANTEVTRVLLAHGADHRALDQADMSPLYWATEAEKISLLLAAGARLCHEDYYNAALFHSQDEGELEAWLAERGGRLADMPQTPDIEEALAEGSRRDEWQDALNSELVATQEELLNDMPEDIAAMLRNLGDNWMRELDAATAAMLNKRGRNG